MIIKIIILSSNYLIESFEINRFFYFEIFFDLRKIKKSKIGNFEIMENRKNFGFPPSVFCHKSQMETSPCRFWIQTLPLGVLGSPIALLYRLGGPFSFFCPCVPRRVPKDARSRANPWGEYRAPWARVRGVGRRRYGGIPRIPENRGSRTTLGAS